MGKSDARYCFAVNWYDVAASITRQYQLIYYTADGTVEMYDLKNRRTFLKRCDYPSITAKDLYKGNTITVYSRQLEIADYGDEFTRKIFCESASEETIMVAAAQLPQMGRILDAIQAAEITISSLVLIPSGGLFLKLTGHKAAETWAELAPKINAELPGAVQTGGGGAALPKPPPLSGAPGTLLLVRPHAVKAGHLGRIVDQVLGSGFEIANAWMTQLNRSNANEFLEVYKGVVPECTDWVNELAEGKAVALHVRFAANPESSVLAARELCGAHDPEIASHLHVHSLRALYGTSKVKNAVHCTDLPEDGPLEVEYFFSILSSAA